MRTIAEIEKDIVTLQTFVRGGHCRNLITDMRAKRILPDHENQLITELKEAVFADYLSGSDLKQLGLV